MDAGPKIPDFAGAHSWLRFGRPPDIAGPPRPHGLEAARQGGFFQSGHIGAGQASMSRYLAILGCLNVLVLPAQADNKPKVIFNDIGVTKGLDQSIPNMSRQSGNGVHFKDAVITNRDAASSPPAGPQPGPPPGFAVTGRARSAPAHVGSWLALDIRGRAGTAILNERSVIPQSGKLGMP
jgi:hypothetical protein